jgi:Response regulator containing CheY-like receiver, AAA-type ATPase, and DNA-binding domains
LANILIIEDDAGIRTVLSRALQAQGHDVLRSERLRDGLNRIQREKPDVVISDVMLPDGNALDYLAGVKKQFGIPVIVISARNNVLTAIRAGKAGAFEYLPKPFDMDVLMDVVARALAQGHGSNVEDHEPEEVLPIVGRSNNMQEIFRMLGKVIQTDLSVMITGESGTGKELIARTLHDHGSRSEKPFVAVNMAAIPADLIETELFGYERGAFTGADHRHEGKFEQAEGGTLFLEEIGDMPETAQTRLMGVLQEGEFTRVGGR